MYCKALEQMRRDNPEWDEYIEADLVPLAMVEHIVSCPLCEYLIRQIDESTEENENWTLFKQ